MRSPIGVKIDKARREDGSFYWHTNYEGEQCPFCGSTNYGGGGSWSPDGCLDCGAINFMGWVKEA